MIELSGDTAKVRANLLGFHVHREDRPGSHYDIGERYHFEMIGTADGWRVSHMSTEPVWTAGDDPPPFPPVEFADASCVLHQCREQARHQPGAASCSAMAARFTTNRNLIGILSLCLGIFIFSTQDAIIKAVSSDYSVTQAIVTRSIVAFPILLLFVHWEGGVRLLVSRRFWALSGRGLILLVSYTSYYLAFPALPLAEAIVLFFTAPFLVTLLAAPVLGERIRAKAIVALIAGFAGVLVILRPGFGFFEPAALLSLLSAITYALAMLFARKLGVSEPASVMAFYQNAIYLLGAGLMAALFHALGITTAEHPSVAFLVRPWAWPDALSFIMMAACGVIAAVAMSLLTHAYRMADASLVTVFEYTGMIWGPLWGFLFFAETPPAATFLGMLLIMMAGLIVLLRSRPGQTAKSDAANVLKTRTDFDRC